MAPPDSDRGLKFNALGDRMPVTKGAHIMRDMVKFYEKATKKPSNDTKHALKLCNAPEGEALWYTSILLADKCTTKSNYGIG